MVMLIVCFILGMTFASFCWLIILVILLEEIVGGE